VIPTFLIPNRPILQEVLNNYQLSQKYLRNKHRHTRIAEGFGEALKRKATEEEIRRTKKQLTVVFGSAACRVGVEPEVLGGADRGWEVSRARALVGYVLIRRLGYRLKDVAKCLGRDLATVSSLVSRFSERLAEDGRLRKQAERLAEDCQE